MALLLAVKLCKDLDLHHIVLKGDATQVINLTKEGPIDWSEGGMLIHDTFALCNSFTQWSMQLLRGVVMVLPMFWLKRQFLVLTM